jgi:hypothetical protein
MPQTQPPIEQDPEQQLRLRLAELDEERSASLAAIESEIASNFAALATAGSQYDDAIAGAEENYEAAQEGYDDFLSETTQTLNDAQAAITAIDTDPADVGTVSDIVITTGGTPDCSAADIQAAVNIALAEIRESLSKIEDKLNDGNLGHTKDALQKLKETGQGFRDQFAPSDDAAHEAEKAAKYGQLDDLFTQ